jgi:hypothetical protein
MIGGGMRGGEGWPSVKASGGGHVAERCGSNDYAEEGFLLAY